MLETALPPHFCKMMEELLGEHEAKELIEALNSDSPSSIRLSKGKKHLLPINALPLSSSIPWCPLGYSLEYRPMFTGDAAFHGGVYYVQEASSMLLYQVQALLGDKPICALDLCAAPGGKSTLLIDILPPKSVLVSNEIVKTRAHILYENLSKWGSDNCIITNTTAEKLAGLRSAFNFILVDAPCSGEGMFRKDVHARKEWHDNSPLSCSERQREIIDNIWDALRIDGLFVYSTCTMNRAENEDIVSYIVEHLGAEPIDLDICLSEVCLSPFSPYPCYRMMPHRVSGEGLFMAVFRKVSDTSSPCCHKTNIRTKRYKYDAVPPNLQQWIKLPEAYQWEQLGDTLRAYPSYMIELLQQLKSHSIPIISAGIEVATVKGNKYLPHPALALSSVLTRESFDRISLSAEQVIRYLRGEAIVLDHTASTGIKLVEHSGIPLGFVKHIGQRANNLYPQEWRIRNATLQA